MAPPGRGERVEVHAQPVGHVIGHPGGHVGDAIATGTEVTRVSARPRRSSASNSRSSWASATAGAITSRTRRPSTRSSRGPKCPASLRSWAHALSTSSASRRRAARRARPRSSPPAQGSPDRRAAPNIRRSNEPDGRTGAGHVLLVVPPTGSPPPARHLPNERRARRLRRPRPPGARGAALRPRSRWTARRALSSSRIGMKVGSRSATSSSAASTDDSARNSGCSSRGRCIDMISSESVATDIPVDIHRPFLAFRDHPQKSNS